MGLLDVGSSVDKGEAIGNTPPGHVVPALGDGEGRIRAEAQIPYGQNIRDRWECRFYDELSG